MAKQLFYRITVLALFLCQVGSVIVVQAGDHPIATTQAEPVTSFQYLPIVFKPFNCPNFFDDFSNPASGWFVGEDNTLLAEYLGGEYHVVVKKKNSSSIINAPTCKRQNYTVEVDAHWDGVMGATYGLMLGTMENPRRFYTFEVNTASQEFTVYSYGPGGWDLIVTQPSEAILEGAATNHLKVTHRGGEFTAVIGTTEVYNWIDTTKPGEKGLGLIIISNPNDANTEAHFDNFSVTNIYR
jgi:hypothetical protein